MGYHLLTCDELQPLSWVTLGVKGRVAAVADLTDEAGGKSLSVAPQQHTVAALQGHRDGGELHLLLHWKLDGWMDG